MTKKIVIIFFGIVLIASFLRLWDIGRVPPSPDWDEAALGYNAYSIMQTGRDEYGKFLPYVLRSFDDYKPALYVYLIIPFISLFGLSLEIVRLPSALLGILTVFITFFIVRDLLKEPKIRFFNTEVNSSFIALFSTFLLAISPWHIQFSRIAFEANVAVAFNILALFFFLKGLRRPALLVVSALFLALNLYMYQSQKVFAPLFVLSLILIFLKDVLSVKKKYLFAAILIGVIVALPMFYTVVFDKEALARARGVSIFADSTQLLKDNAVRLMEDTKAGNPFGYVFDNRRIVYAKAIIHGYLAHFDLNWLFITSDLPRHHAPFMGLLYLWELPFLFVGIYSLIFGNFNKKMKLVVFLWMLITPIPAAITSGVPHSVRTLNFLPTFQILIAIGIINFMIFISNIKHPHFAKASRGEQIAKIPIKYLIFTVYVFFITFNFLYYLNQYFVQQNYFHSLEWQYGYKETVEEIKKIEGQYDKVIVSNVPHLDQSYMFFLFYLKYPPEEYQREIKNASGGFKETHSFGKYEFRPIQWEKEKKDDKILYVGLPSDFPHTTESVVKIINFLNGEPAIVLVKG